MDVIKRRWSDDELGFLLDHPTWTARQVGEALGRGMQSVQHKRYHLRDGWSPEREMWTESDWDFVRRTPHMTATQVAAHLGRTAASIKNARHLLSVKERLSFDIEGRSKLPSTIGSRTLVAKTCPRCGKFLNAKWFYRLTRVGRPPQWSTDCAKCSHKDDPKRVLSTSARDGGASARASNRRLQAITRERAHRHGQEWIDTDHEILADPDLTAFEKAIRLGRTYNAVRQAVHVNGYTSKVGRGDPVEGVWLIRPRSEPAGGPMGSGSAAVRVA